MVIEGLVTTFRGEALDKRGDLSDQVNFAPMGATVDSNLDRFVLKPFSDSTTCSNLLATGRGVFHITDDVELIARAAIDRWQQRPRLSPVWDGNCWALDEACRWHAFEVMAQDTAKSRVCLECRTVASQRNRDFLGFNRAKHAVLEAAILATRVHLLPEAELAEQFGRLEVLVQKTGGTGELNAWALLCAYLDEHREQAV